METWGITDSGKVRKINQDVYKIHVDEDKNIAVLVVCDGMGGANAGNIASSVAADVFISKLGDSFKKVDDNTTLDTLAEAVYDASVMANKIVYNKGLVEPQCNGMGTTLVALISSDLGEIVANIGDSRAYQITPNGISQITKDHSVVEDMIDRGEITREEAGAHPRKNLITRAVGADCYVETDVYMQNIDSGDIVLLCSDGLSNVVNEDEILMSFRQNSTLPDACESLLEMALARGAPDNVTIAALRK